MGINLYFLQKHLNRPDILCYCQREMFTTGIAQSNPDWLYLEFGLCTGKTAQYICSDAQDKIVYGFDSFAGLEEPLTPINPIGSCSIIGDLPTYHDNVRIVRGRVQDTLEPFLGQHREPVSFAHLDMTPNPDFYVLKTLANYGRLKKGSLLAFAHYIRPEDDLIIGWISKSFLGFAKKYKVKWDYLVFSDVHCVIKILEDVLPKEVK